MVDDEVDSREDDVAATENGSIVVAAVVAAVLAAAVAAIAPG